MEIVDLRTDYEKEQDAKFQSWADRYEYLMTMPKATPCRVMAFVAKEFGVTYLTVRTRLIKMGVYTPKNGSNRA